MAGNNRGSRILIGMKAIKEYYDRDERTIRELIRTENFPAAKVAGRWESNTDLIDRFHRDRIERMVAG